MYVLYVTASISSRVDAQAHLQQGALGAIGVAVALRLEVDVHQAAVDVQTFHLLIAVLRVSTLI